jgi:hypothetical protein
LQLLDENCETTKQSLLATLSNLLQPYRFRDGLDKCMSLEKRQREVGGERKRGGKTPKKKKNQIQGIYSEAHNLSTHKTTSLLSLISNPTHKNAT